MASILITGGAGFIGSNLCRVLLAEGHRVCAVDNFITGKRENVELLLSNARFSFREIDIAEADLTQTFENERFDDIYHLACPTGVPNLIPLAEEMMRTCSIGTFHVLDLAKEHGSRVLCASSAEAYGDPEVFPQREEYTGNVDPIGPRSAYEEGKRFVETCSAMYARKYGMPAVAVRIFNTYGPGMSLDDTRIIPQFVRSVRDGTPLRIYGDGSQTRAHMFIDDLIVGLCLVMEKGKAGDVYNIGSDKPMSVKTLAELMISLTGHTAGIEYRPHFINDHRGRCPSVEKVRRLGWERRVDIEDGLGRMLALHQLPVLAPSFATLGEHS